VRTEIRAKDKENKRIKKSNQKQKKTRSTSKNKFICIDKATFTLLDAISAGIFPSSCRVTSGNHRCRSSRPPLQI
jgi:hypothetical protein